MRVLRIRRGYTTNSSGANEWVPPGEDGGVRDSGSKERTYKNWLPAPKERPDAGLGIERPNLRGRSVPKAETAQPQGPRDRATSNMESLGVLALVVLVFFVLGAAMKRLVTPKR